MYTAYIGLGSNIGNRYRNIKKACESISVNPSCKIEKISSFYETFPVGPSQRDYINAVIKIKTKLSPVLLLEQLKIIERSLGRKKQKKKWLPRVIDLDLLFYGNRLIVKKGLCVPHPEIPKRRFVLEPLVEIAPKLIHPVSKMSIRSILGKLLTQKSQKVKVIK
ncbi:MAG: 2-amino-4-hydroxy-6-hydroxymethyldihydropteridine diphosphokinase [Elusimicrobia bacterium]|nr:2-amino-4-hydroxy-6-hydroxymethyldihydropteridine diphosphokinase [Candidatus Liberimonas magnetica]